MSALPYPQWYMTYEMECNLSLKRNGRLILTEMDAEILRQIHECGTLEQAGKRLGLPVGDLAGSLGSINRRSTIDLVRICEDSVDLTPEGEEALRTFDLKRRMLDEQLQHLWRKPYLTADGVLIETDKVLLVRRGREPGKGLLALPGGIVNYGERLEECVVREVEEETGIVTEVVRLVGVLSDPERDPRGHFVTAVYELRRIGGVLRAGDDASEIGFFPLNELPNLAFDHAHIIEMTLRKGDRAH
jgi:8-oxo-dGTP diphosphatase